MWTKCGLFYLLSTVIFVGDPYILCCLASHQSTIQGEDSAAVMMIKASHGQHD